MSRNFLDDLLPIRRILVDGEEKPFVVDLDFNSESFSVEIDEESGVLSLDVIAGSPSDATPAAVAAAGSAGVSEALSRGDHAHAHGTQAGGSLHAVAVAVDGVGISSGFMSGSDKAKLDGITAANAAPPAIGTAGVVGVSTEYAREEHTHALGPGPFGPTDFDTITVNGGGAFSVADDGIGTFGSSVESPIVIATDHVAAPVVRNTSGPLDLDGNGGVTLTDDTVPVLAAYIESGVSRLVGQGASSSRIESTNGTMEVRGATGVVISHATNELCTLTRNGSNQVVQSINASRAGFGFEGSGSQYCYMRGPGGVYADCPTFYVRNAAGNTNVCTITTTANFTSIEGYGSAGMGVGPAQKTTTGAGTPMYVHGQAVQAGQEGTSKAGNVNIQLGRVIGTSDQKTGALNIHDHLGAAVECALYGIDGPGGGTYGCVFTGATAGADGRARSIAFGFNSPSQVAFVASTADLTMDSVGVRFRHANANRINAAANDTTIAATAAGYNALEWNGNSGLHTERNYWNRVQTTTATTSTAWTSPTIPNGATVTITAEVILNTDGISAGSYLIRGTFRAAAGTLTQIGSTAHIVPANEDVAGWDATFDTSGATARVRVTSTAVNLATEVYPTIRYCGAYA